jgi:iron transport multicopper oxidase
MMFNGTNYYDGAVGITQCSIPNGKTMDYYIDTSLQVRFRFSGAQVERA